MRSAVRVRRPVPEVCYSIDKSKLERFDDRGLTKRGNVSIRKVEMNIEVSADNRTYPNINETKPVTLGQLLNQDESRRRLLPVYTYILCLKNPRCADLIKNNESIENNEGMKYPALRRAGKTLWSRRCST